MTQQESGHSQRPSDSEIIASLADMSRRLYDPLYNPPYKIGAAFLEHFVNKPLEERAGEYTFGPESYDLYAGLDEVSRRTHLGANYNLLLAEEERRLGYSVSHSEGAVAMRFRDIKDQIVADLNHIGDNVAKLEEDPTHKYEIALLSYSGSTASEVEEKFRHDLSGDDLFRTRYGDHNLDDVKQLVTRSALLWTLGFNLFGNNTIVRDPNFVGRIATEDENTTRTMLLWWSWNHPHVFYAQDRVEVTGGEPQVTITEKVVVASVYDIAKYFALIHTEPQDMKLKYPADSVPESESKEKTKELQTLIDELSKFLSNPPEEA